MDISGTIHSTAPSSKVSTRQSSAVASLPMGHGQRASPPPQPVANRKLKYTVYDENKIAVTVIDKGSGRTIREIPAEEIQKLSEHIDAMMGSIDEFA